MEVRSGAPHARRCERCKTILNQYNEGNYCAICERSDDRISGSGESGARTDHLIDFGARLPKARQRRGMTAEVLAGLCGVTTAYISMIENDKRSADRYSLIISLADALRVPPGEIAPALPMTISDPANVRPSGKSTAEATITGIAQDDDEAVRRRVFLLNLAAFSQLGDGDASWALEAARRTLVDSPGRASGSRRPEPSPPVSELCSLLTNYGLASHQSDTANLGETRPMADLERALKITFDTYQQGRFTSAAGRACTVLADVQVAMQACSDSEHRQALKLLALSTRPLRRSSPRPANWTLPSSPPSAA